MPTTDVTHPARRLPYIRRRLTRILALSLIAGTATASPWADVGDRTLRSDIEMLAAHQLIDGPITTWPIPVGFFARLRDSSTLAGQPEYLRLAADRLLARLDGQSGLRPAAEFRVASDPNLIRDFGAAARDEADLRAGLDYDGNTFAARLRVGALTRIDGDQSRFTLDGSYASTLLGNWQLYGGWIDKWYGPGYTSSLILSNNSRPFPKIGITRNSPGEFETKWLSWLGTWQLDFYVGLLEEDARLESNTGVGSLRFAFMPATGLEIAITRFVQFCGGGNNCNPVEAAFAINNTDSDRNNSNDQATIEVKYTRSFEQVLFSPYAQFLNDDTGPFTHSYTSYLGGLNWAGPWGDEGTQWSLTAEYTDSRATLDWFTFGKRLPGFAYNNDEYIDGFRYRGRTLGFSLDSDSVLFSLTGALTDRAGRQYRLSYYNAQISTQELARIQADGSFRRNSVSAQPVQIDQVEGGISLPWNRLLFDLAVRWQDDQPFPKSGSTVNVEAGVQIRF